MARKSARAIAAAEAPTTTNNGVSTSNKASLLNISAKSCLTCGRVITPRAKWAKDWAGIKYCSDRCRSTRPGKLVATFPADGNVSALEGCTGVKVEGEEVSVDVEMFIEAILLDVAAGKRESTLEDVQDTIQFLLKSASILMEASTKATGGGSDTASEESSGNKTQENGREVHPFWKALDSPPGLRERIRRAARRLALGITHDSDPKQTTIVTTDLGSIELIQGGKLLRTVQDLSFAKGVIHIKPKKAINKT